ncbi:MAG TPA: CapA family protein [Thermodesulfobacteriota bacterium]|nr:CapA family protein [Thermodesulfobacteriota bacterium]
MKNISFKTLLLILSLVFFLPNNAPATDSIEDPPAVSLIAVGDIMLSRGVAGRIRRNNDPNYPFLKVKDFLKTGDIVFGNLECPITDGRKIVSKEMTFRADPASADALKQAGFTVLSLANNHSPNFGKKGLKDTFSYLKGKNIKYAGAGIDADEANSPAYMNPKGISFAFLAYNDPDVVPGFYEAAEKHAGTAFMRIDKMTDAVKKAASEARFVIVSMHSGNEYDYEPNEAQKKFARAAIDAGAELVIGHHPHVIQPVEKYKGKLIFYSLGNFIFDQSEPKETKEGVMVKFIFTKDALESVEATPVFIERYAQPRLIEGEEGRQVVERLKIPREEKDVLSSGAPVKNQDALAF